MKVRPTTPESYTVDATETTREAVFPSGYQKKGMEGQLESIKHREVEVKNEGEIDGINQYMTMAIITKDSLEI